jgi:hypothetical protein
LIEERKHFDILKSVEDFDTSQLKKTDTVEKLVLPNEEGSKLLKSDELLCETD